MKRFFSILLAVIFAASAANITVCADEAVDIISGITDFKLTQAEAENVQEWIDGALTEEAGQSSEWYAFTLSRSTEYDFSHYASALLKYVKENEIRSAVTKQKYALILTAMGYEDSFISETADSTIGEQGVMSVVYGLHLLNNGAHCSAKTTDEVISELLSLQKSDGGWAIMGDIGENDTTAMAVQALSPYYGEKDNVTEAVNKAVFLLSERQLESGDFSSYGVPNAESTAQVVVMLTSLKINPLEDERFIKNGNTLWDGLTLYRNSDGSFSHEAGAEYAESATVQTFYAAVSLKRFYESKSPLYIFEEAITPEFEEEAIPPEIIVTTKAETEITAQTEAPVQTEKASLGYKPWVCLCIIAAGGICAVILAALKKGKKQNFIVLAIITAAAVMLVIFTDFQSAENYYGDEAVKANPIGTVTLSIRCDTVAGKSEKEYIPEDGIILTDSFRIEENETVFDILIEAAKKHGIHLDYSDSSYIRGINYLYEFDFGDLSGWLYYVNGEAASVGCDSFILSDGDNIEWLYTCEMGNDLK